MENQEREGFKSRLGFILVSAGCAIGIGNVWKFPYVCGQNGGAIFVIIYLIFLAIMGIPILTMELAIGRRSGKTIIQAYKTLEKPGSKWHLHGWICLLGNLLLMMYYTTVAGWMLMYFWEFLSGKIVNPKPDDTGEYFDNLLANPRAMIVFTIAIIWLGFIVISFGVKKGLEKVNKIMMIGLLGLIMVLAVRCMFLENASAGIKFYLMPDLDRVNEVGWGNVITSAMTQAFFTLSLGIASMEVFGSYMSKDYRLTGEAIKIGVLDTFVAIISGLIIFSACFSFSIAPDQGPSLIFVTLPKVFTSMNGGRVWGTMFFLFMTFASFSTIIAVLENMVGICMDTFKWDRFKAVLINFIVVILTSLPCMLSFNILSDVTLPGGKTIMESEDFIVSNLLLPLGSLVVLLFCTSKFGWGADEYFDEVNTGKGIRMSRKLVGYYRFVLPIIVLIIIVKGLI